MKVIIVGGVAGGASTAARLRRLDENADIVIYERSGYISYANCGLPYYIGGVITDKSNLTLQSPEGFYTRFRVSARVRHEVIAVDPEKKTVTVRDLLTDSTFQDSYDKLVLAPGARAVLPDLPGISTEGIFTLRTVEDTYRIIDGIKENKARSAVVIGGGFVGLESAENLRRLGLEVTLVEAAPQVLSILDEDMAAQVHSLLRKNEIRLVLGDGIARFDRENNKITTTLTSGSSLTSDIVMLAIGVLPDTKFLDGVGLKKGIKGGIVVNDRMETSLPDIYAVGDAVLVEHFITKKSSLISLAGPANKQGRIAADNIAGGDSRYKGTQGSSIIKLFDMTVATTGINERQAISEGLAYEKIIISPMSSASYYPGGRVMTVKMLFENRTQKILGAQIIGSVGVDKRIDILATAMRGGLRATELSELESAYAPPFSSAKDPINMLGFVAENLTDGRVKQFYLEDIKALQKNGGVTLLDVRTPEEYACGNVDGFFNIPVDALRDRISEISKKKPVYVMCQSGIRSYIACRILSGHGYDCYNFAGGYRFYASVENERAASAISYACGADKE